MPPALSTDTGNLKISTFAFPLYLLLYLLSGVLLFWLIALAGSEVPLRPNIRREAVIYWYLSLC